jgi:hypothetical protein
LGFSYSFNQGNSVFFLNGDEGLDELRPKLRDYINDPRWHYGQTKVLGSLMGRKYAVLSWEEIQATADILVEKVKPSRVALHYESDIVLEGIMIAHAQFVKHKIPCRIFTEFDKAMDWISETPEHITGMYRFEGDVLWITLRDCQTLEEVLQPFKRAMKNPKFDPGLTVVWDLTLQHTITAPEENSSGVKWLVENGLAKTALLISNRINRNHMEEAVEEYRQHGAAAEIFTDVAKLDQWLETS